MDLFRSFNQVGVTMLIATHDDALIERYNARALHLQHGELMP